MVSTDVAGLLDDLRRRGSDHRTVEAKRSRQGIPQGLWESISAFANASGGEILLGVDEANGFAVTGVDDPGQAEHLVAGACGEMDPPVRAVIETHVVEGEAVVTAMIPPVPRDERPCHRRSLGPYMGSRIRVADGNRRMTEYEVSVLLANRREQRDDQSVVSEASLDDLDETAVRTYVSRIRATKPAVFGSMSDEAVLTMTNVAHDGTGSLVPTLAGLLAFGIYPQRFFPQLNVSLVRYPTPVAGEPGPGGERFMDSVVIDGSVPTMLAEAVSALKRNMQRRSVVMGLFRHDEWEYPEVALREALTNALVHRDLSPGARGAQVQIEMYPDRLVIRNPGGLYGPVAVEDLGLSGTSSTRNKALLKILADTSGQSGRPVCENLGSGIFTMRRALADAGMEPPTFVDNISTFEVTLPNHTLLDKATLEWLSRRGAEGLNGPQLIAVALARRGQVLSNSFFRSATGVADSREAGRLLKDLVDQGLLAMDGSRGSATYHLPGTEPEAIPSTAVLDVAHTVLAALGEGPRTRREIETRTGLPRSTVSYHLARLRDTGRVEMIGVERSRHTTWRLRDGQGRDTRASAERDRG